MQVQFDQNIQLGCIKLQHARKVWGLTHTYFIRYAHTGKPGGWTWLGRIEEGASYYRRQSADLKTPEEQMNLRDHPHSSHHAHECRGQVAALATIGRSLPGIHLVPQSSEASPTSWGY